MARKNFSVRLDGKEYKLRLTAGGQKALRQRFNEVPLEIAMTAANDEERLTALLTEALNWPDSGNTITDGEEFYDLLVDNGYAGQGRFNALVMDIVAASGMIKPDVAAKNKTATDKLLDRVYNQIFDRMESGGLSDDAETAAETEENPTTQPNG